MAEPLHIPAGTQRALGTVLDVQSVTPRMRRITLGGEQIAAFSRAPAGDAPAAWVKLFLPSGEGRAYTLRSVDRQAGTLDIDLVLHGDAFATGHTGDQALATHGGDGPASRWAARARVGEQVAIAGPRSGGFAPPAGTDWLLLAGDGSALPAMQSIAASLPASARVKACVEIIDDGECQPMDSAANWRTEWITAAPGHPGQRLCQRLMYRPLPPGNGYLWMAGESGAMRALKLHFLDRGMARPQLSTKGYWKSGEADHRDR
jgi:NADPH-dependent ferric siderophore reductase